MKKTLKQQARDKVKKQKATVMFWDSKGTSDLHNMRQSINQKTERSEEDVKERINHIVAPLAILIIVDILISFAILVR